ncbi:putative mitochondrial protein [Sesamum angolense]|uniref:Mitochondrial protein n=1 Tax=Sesamum angolense TaxID=2727404 RepID=A0AAE1X3D5_9LAMI|nr:putative mitochondrial protein [Sesamum angolense]
MIAWFLWNNQGFSKIHWVSYEQMCESKLKGSLGFCHLHLFNQAMLAKQLWRILCYLERLLYRVLKGWYFPNNDMFSATLGHHPSFTWRSLMSNQELFLTGSYWRVGSCTSIRIWFDSWLPRPLTFSPITQPPVAPRKTFVAKFGISRGLVSFFGPLIPLLYLAFLLAGLIMTISWTLNKAGGRDYGRPSSQIRVSHFHTQFPLISTSSLFFVRLSGGVEMSRQAHAELTEALAAREAILLAQRQDWRSIIIEGDCVSLLHKLQSDYCDLSKVGLVFSDILLATPSFIACDCNCVHRECNSIAHLLAKSGFGTFEVVLLYLLQLPPCFYGPYF